MKLKLTHNMNSTVLAFEDGGSIYAAPHELAKRCEPKAPITTYIDDGYKQGLVKGWQIVLVREPESGGMGKDRGECWRYACDTVRLFKRVLELREKRIETTLDLDRFQEGPRKVEMLGIMQMIRHPHALGRFAPTVKYFRSKLTGDEFERLLRDLSAYLPRAKLYGQVDEFYFDGRIAGGCGFNGGIILHGEEYSIHT